MKDMLKLTWEITAKPEFSKEQLQEFHDVVCQDKVSKKALSECSIVKTCMKQGGFTSVDEYIQSDKTLSDFMGKKGIDDLDRTVKSDGKSLQKTFSNYQM